MKNTLLLYASYYHNLGMNITHMQGVENIPKSFKDPTDYNWNYYSDKEQSVSYVLQQKWEQSTGVGLVIGYNGYRAIDIDYIHPQYALWMLFHDDRDKFRQSPFWDFLSDCLKLLGLPEDYPWVVLSGSHQGIHIIFKADEVNGVDFDSVSYTPNQDYLWSINEGVAGERLFRNMELRWKDHLILPPSNHISGNQYEFIYGIPSIYPMHIKINDINNFLNHFCGRTTYIPFYREDFFPQEFYLAKKVKTYSDSDSWGYPRILKEDNKQWLLKCGTPDALNSLGVEAVKENNISQAILYFRQSNNNMAHYNLATLIVHGCLFHLENELDYHLMQVGNLDISELEEHAYHFKTRNDLP